MGRVPFVISALLLGPALSGCILGTERPDLNLEVPATYREGGRTAPDAHVPALDWWRGFRSGELISLMDAAQLYNLDVAVAIAQIIQADAQVGVQGAPLLPSVSGTGNAEQARNASGSLATGGGVGGKSFSQYSLGLTASYIVDFWGKNRATLHAAEESATASRYNREVVTLTAMVTVATRRIAAGNAGRN
jgi:multidrug efflux system outer membrane protein